MKKIIPILIFVALTMNAQEHTVEPLPIGNFALSISQQPGPLYGFGQNIVDTHDLQCFESMGRIKGKRSSFFANEITIIYGLSEESSIFLAVPVPVMASEDHQHITAFGDIFIQGEYAYFDRRTQTSITQATAVGSIFLPTGILAATKPGPDIVIPTEPFTGMGSVSFFLGGTLSHTTVDWYLFGSLGALITTQRNATKLGNTLFYQGGIGHNLRHYDDRILLLAFELDGIYEKRDKLLGLINSNSGGNTIFFGPALWYSTKRFIFQVGIQTPISQRLNGIQSKTSYYFSISFAWLFNHDEYDR